MYSGDELYGDEITSGLDPYQRSQPARQHKAIPTVWDAREALARWYAQRKGIRGATGGWLYSASGEVLAQGYRELYRRHKRAIWQEFDAWSGFPKT